MFAQAKPHPPSSGDYYAARITRRVHSFFFGLLLNTWQSRRVSAPASSLWICFTEAPLFSEIDRLAAQSRAVKSQMCSRPFDRRQMQIFPGSFPSISFTTRSLQKKILLLSASSLVWHKNRFVVSTWEGKKRFSCDSQGSRGADGVSCLFVFISAICSNDSRLRIESGWAFCLLRVIQADGWSLVQIVVCELWRTFFSFCPSRPPRSPWKVAEWSAPCSWCPVETLRSYQSLCGGRCTTGTVPTSACRDRWVRGCASAQQLTNVTPSVARAAMAAFMSQREKCFASVLPLGQCANIKEQMLKMSN